MPGRYTRSLADFLNSDRSGPLISDTPLGMDLLLHRDGVKVDAAQNKKLDEGIEVNLIPFMKGCGKEKSL